MNTMKTNQSHRALIDAHRSVLARIELEPEDRARADKHFRALLHALHAKKPKESRAAMSRYLQMLLRARRRP